MLIILRIVPVATPFPAVTPENAIAKVCSVNLVIKSLVTVCILCSIGRHDLIPHYIRIYKRVYVYRPAVAVSRDSVGTSHHPIIEGRGIVIRH